MTRQLNESLFHYTTVDGALGILESKNLYATHVRYLNDISEIDHFKGFVHEELLELSESIKGDNARVFAHIRMIASEFASSIVDEVERLVDIYTLSFSIPSTDFVWKNGLLSQWRSYGSDGGVVIEFDKDKFHNLLNEQSMRSENLYYADTVTYGNDVKRIVEMKEDFRSGVLEQLESMVYRLYFRRTQSGLNESLAESISAVLTEDFQMYVDMLSKISKWAIFFKHEAFHEECEYRISVQRPLYPNFHDKEVFFRIRKGIPTPYTLLLSEVSELPIIRLIVGPHRDAKLRLSAFATALSRRGINAKIDLSSIPFV